MWILFALGASLFWGLTYVLYEEIYKKISIFTSLSITSFVIFLVMLLIAYLTGNLKPDVIEITSSKKLFYYLLSGIGALMIAELLIGFSIVAKNATLSGLIEISYPIFIALFSYILFRHTLNMATIIGGVIVFIGIFVIYYFNR